VLRAPSRDILHHVPVRPLDNTSVKACTPAPTARAQATEVLAPHGAATAHSLVDLSRQAADATPYQPQPCGGLVHDLPRARAASDAQATQASPRHAEAATRRWHELFVQWRQAPLARLRAALPAEELAALEAERRARLIADGAPAYTLGLAVRVAVDEVLAAQAGLPTFEVWRARQEAGR
jgi:hypothetical protein